MINEGEHHEWIRQFDETVGCCGDKDLINAKPTDSLSLFLNWIILDYLDYFWDLITSETNRYAHQFLDRLKPKSRVV